MGNNKSPTKARFGVIYSTSKTNEYLLRNDPIDNRFLFKNKQTLELLSPKIRTVGSFYLRANSNSERILVTDSVCSNDFSEISLAYLLSVNKSRYQKFRYKIS